MKAHPATHYRLQGLAILFMNPCNETIEEFSARMTLLMNEGRADEAIRNIEEKLAANPADDALHYLLGNAYRRLSNWQKALEHYAEAIELNSESPARQAKAMLTDILDYRCKDLLNP